MRTIGHFLNGANVAGTSGRFGDIYNPATGEVQARVALASKAEMRKAVETRRRLSSNGRRSIRSAAPA